MKMYKWMLSLFAFMIWMTPYAYALDYSHQDLDDQFVQDVLAIFPERQVIPDALINFSADPNIQLSQEAEVFITFIDEGAGYKNQFGFFTYEDQNGDGVISPDEILSETIIFANASKQGGGGDLLTGDTVNLGQFPAGTNIGFFLVADGYNNPNGTRYYTIDNLNPNQERHLAMVAMLDYDSVVLGIEDLPLNRSDLDFNDVVFTFSTNPIEALQELVEEGKIPTECELLDDATDREDCREEILVPETPVVEPIIDPGLPEAPAVVEETAENGQTIETENPGLLEGSGTIGCSLASAPVASSAWLWFSLSAGLLLLMRMMKRKNG